MARILTTAAACGLFLAAASPTGAHGLSGASAVASDTLRVTLSGTATAGEDYTALSGEVTVAKGESAARIALETLDDGILDKGETVVLALTGATGPGTVLVDETRPLRPSRTTDR